MKIIVLGATSEIAEAACCHLAPDKPSFMLIGRDADKLEAVAKHLTILGADKVLTATADLARTDPASALQDWVAQLGGVDAVILAYGQLGDQVDLAQDLNAARALIDVNYASAAGWCLGSANIFESQSKGVLAVVGSVAGDRGRQSNFIYGSTKAALATLVAGISHRLAPTNAHAILIKPGQVATAMTAHMDRSGPLWATPKIVGKAIADAVRNPKGGVVYSPGFWKWIMLIIRSVPNAIFHRTKL